MEKSIITTGKTIDLAIAAAVEQLKMDRDNFSVEVLENAKSGFLGIGASPAKIKVTFEVPDEVVEPAPALSSASRSKPKPRQEAPKPAAAKPAPQKQPEPAAKPSEPNRQEQRKAPKAERPARAERAPRTDAPAAAPKVQKVYAPAPDGSTEQQIEVFIKGLLERMGSDAVPHAERAEGDNFRVELVGENLGMLIGRRGETLDAIQHLTNYVVNHDAGKRSRVTVDAENYRVKREESLQHLAQKMASKAVRYRKNFTLEPMNAYERHVIHAALQDTPDVTTFSTGTEPNRRIVIAYSKQRNN